MTARTARAAIACALVLVAAVGCRKSDPAPAPDPAKGATSFAKAKPIAGPPFSGVAQVALGDVHSCARKIDGTVWCWGDNSFQTLGDGTSEQRGAPTQVVGLHDVAELAVAGLHSCARVSDAVWCWGRNGLGVVGDGTTIDRPSPVAVVGLAGAAQIAVATSRSCARLVDETVRCWGNTEWSVKSTAHELAPIPMGRLSHVAQLALGWSHACARADDGSTSCWGTNVFGGCGDGTELNEVAFPTPVAGDHRFTRVAVGQGHTCAIDEKAKLWCWGSNSHGQLGDGTTTRHLVPAEVPALGDVVQVTLNWESTCTLRATGEVLCWGGNEYGELGDGTTSARSTPAPIAGMNGAKQIALGSHHACAILANDTLACWGRNQYGQLGFPSDETCGMKEIPCARRPQVVPKGLSGSTCP